MPATCPCCGITLRAAFGTGLRNAPLMPRPSPVCPWASSAERLTPRPRLSSVEVICSCFIRTESRNESGQELGREGLLALVRGLPMDSLEGPVAFGHALVARLEEFRGSGPRRDDETLVVLQRQIEIET